MTDLPADAPRGGLLRSETARPYLVVVAMAAAMWVLELIDLLPGVDLDRWGVSPRELTGLIGIVTAPFLHADLPHLINNTIPFVVLGCIIASAGVQRFVQVTVIVGLTSGLGIWLLGPSGTEHIGASGLVFGYLTYLLSRGVFERKVGYLVLALVVLFFYGGILWGLLPKTGISWQGHVFGAAGGVLAAWVIHGRRPPETGS